MLFFVIVGETYEQSMGPEYWRVASVRTSYVVSLWELSRRSQVEQHLLPAAEKIRKSLRDRSARAFREQLPTEEVESKAKE